MVVATRRRQPVLSCAFLKSEGGKYSVVQGLSSCQRSKLFNGVHLVFSIQPQVSPLPPAKLSDDQPLGETLATSPNKDNFLKSDIARKTLTLNRICWSNCSPFFKFSTIFFEKASKLQLRNVHFQQQQQNILNFFYCVNFVFIYISEIVPIR